MRKIKKLLLGSILLLALSCSKESSSDKDDFPYYFTATINGSTVKYQANDIDSRYSCGTSQSESASIPNHYDIYEGTTIEDDQNANKNKIVVYILKYFNHDPTYAERVAMIKLGNYSYGYSDVSSSTVNGASIDYTDANGNWWSSEFGSQTGSTFAITELIDNTDGTSGKIFTAKFNCKLYDGNGASIQVTNATIRGKILSP
jgi:hypothetical protein